MLAEKDGHILNLKDELELLKEKNNTQERDLKISREEYFEVNREYERKRKIHE